VVEAGVEAGVEALVGCGGGAVWGVMPLALEAEMGDWVWIGMVDILGDRSGLAVGVELQGRL